MITRETDYAIRAVLCLAQAHREERIISVSELSERMEIPYRFLRALSRKLVAAKVVVSKRGNGGGLALARPPGTISLLEVIRVMDPKNVLLNRCLITGDSCTRAVQCPVHSQLDAMQKQLDAMLDAVHFDRF